MTAADAGARLAEALGEDPPEEIRELPDAAQIALCRVLTQSQDRQSRLLEDSLEEALSYVPALLRGAVKRILFP